MTPPRYVPSRHHPLHGFRLKINRAQAHADALKAEVDAWLERRPYEIIGKYDPGPPERYVFLPHFFEPIPPEWGILLGDFAHNARSGLDHLAYQLVSLGNGGFHQDATRFPILLSPYHRRDLYGQSIIWETLHDPLAVLNRLANVDKHIVLSATPASVESIGWDVVPVSDIGSIGAAEADTGFLLSDKPVVTVNIVSNGPNPKLKLDHFLEVEIWIQHRVHLPEETFTLPRVPLKQTMDDILARVREIFEVFVGEFSAPTQ